MTPLITDSVNFHAYHVFVVKLDLAILNVDRSQIFYALRAENIGVNVHYLPVGWHPIYQRNGFRKGSCPNGEGAYEQILTLPLWPAMSSEDVDDVLRALKKVIKAYRR